MGPSIKKNMALKNHGMQAAKRYLTTVDLLKKQIADKKINENMSNYIWAIDYGHGGMINGVYQTSVKYWKRAFFKNGILLNPADYNYDSDKMLAESDLHYFEGEGNRDIARRIFKLCDANGIQYFDVVNSEKDISLGQRVINANNFYLKNKNTLYLSIHSNAFGKQSANGWAVYTSPGTTLSDKIATIFFNQVQQDFPNTYMRKDTSDGDVDWEDYFTVLTKTYMPAILTENFFYTNYEEAKFLASEEGRQKIAESHFKAMITIEKNGI
jgi:N-acetylmuramoyl-L-alanine amidase